MLGTGCIGGTEDLKLQVVWGCTIDPSRGL